MSHVSGCRLESIDVRTFDWAQQQTSMNASFSEPSGSAIQHESRHTQNNKPEPTTVEDDDVFHEFFPGYRRHYESLPHNAVESNEDSTRSFIFPGLDPVDANWADDMMSKLRKRRNQTYDLLRDMRSHAENALAEASLAEAELEQEMSDFRRFMKQIGDLVGQHFLKYLKEKYDEGDSDDGAIYFPSSDFGHEDFRDDNETEDNDDADENEGSASRLLEEITQEVSFNTAS